MRILSLDIKFYTGTTLDNLLYNARALALSYSMEIAP
jgi:hypothetical protein